MHTSHVVHDNLSVGRKYNRIMTFYMRQVQRGRVPGIYKSWQVAIMKPYNIILSIVYSMV